MYLKFPLPSRLFEIVPQGLRPSDLAAELDLSPVAAKDILDAVAKPSGVGSDNDGARTDSVLPSSSEQQISSGRSAQDMYREQRGRRTIITFCKAIDGMLGGGVHLGEMIE